MKILFQHSAEIINQVSYPLDDTQSFFLQPRIYIVIVIKREEGDGWFI